MLWRGLRFLLPGLYARKAPFEAARCIERGSALAEQERYGQAIALFSKAVEIDPRSGNAFVQRGIARAMTGDVHGALADFDRAIDINPQDDNAHSCRGSALGAADSDEAIAAFTRAININPMNADAYYGRGVAYYGRHEFDSGIADLSRAIEFQPARANAYYTRGNCWKEKREWDHASADLDRALALNPDDLSAHYNRGAARLAKGNVDGALSDFDVACERNVVSGFTGDDGTIFSCYVAADPVAPEGRVACIIQWSLGFLNRGWDHEVIGGLRAGGKVFLIVTDRLSETESTLDSESRTPDGAAQLLALLGAPRVRDFEGRCPDICRSAAGESVRYLFDVGELLGECETAGDEGTLRVAGLSFDLADGRFFLVAHRTGRPLVRQLNRSLASIEYSTGYLRQLAQSDPELRSFFAS
jgi:Flp pilus assembly protein TadD